MRAAEPVLPALDRLTWSSRGVHALLEISLGDVFGPL
jgi:hypothetical protein